MQNKYKYYKLTTKEKEEITQGIRRILVEDGRVLLALIYGSFIELDCFRDIDLAIYIPKYDLKTIFSIANKIEEEIGIPVDVIPIQEVDSKQKLHILRNGLILLEQVPGLYEALIMQALDELALISKYGN